MAAPTTAVPAARAHARIARRRRVALFAGASLLLIGAALLAPRPAHALTPLDETELAQVSGRTGLAISPAELKKAPFVGGLLALLAPLHRDTRTLDGAQFAAALAARGVAAPLPASLYEGQPVTQAVIDAPPADMRFEAGALLDNLGVHYRGPSFGTIDIRSFDARGTTLWAWGH